jgi:hypothetical protein
LKPMGFRAFLFAEGPILGLTKHWSKG